MLALSWASVFELYYTNNPESEMCSILRWTFLEPDSRCVLSRSLRLSCFT
jgi:hypothetical protein